MTTWYRAIELSDEIGVVIGYLVNFLSALLARFYNTRIQVIENPGLNGQPMYNLDHPLTQEGVDDLIDRSVDRLLEVNSPSLETIKMQVAFDTSYITEEENLISFYQRRSTRLREMQRVISTMKPKGGADFDALTALHRQVRYVDEHRHCVGSRGVPTAIGYSTHNFWRRW